MSKEFSPFVLKMARLLCTKPEDLDLKLLNRSRLLAQNCGTEFRRIAAEVVPPMLVARVDGHWICNDHVHVAAARVYAHLSSED